MHEIDKFLSCDKLLYEIPAGARNWPMLVMFLDNEFSLFNLVTLPMKLESLLQSLSVISDVNLRLMTHCNPNL